MTRALRQALGARGPHVVGRQRLEQAGPHQPGRERQLAGRQHERGQREVMQDVEQVARARSTARRASVMPWTGNKPVPSASVSAAIWASQNDGVA